MTKREWLQALLDGKTMTSDEANGNPVFLNKNGKFESIDSSDEYQNANINCFNKNLREYFEYPMWFKSIADTEDNGMIVRYDSLNNGIVVVEAKNGYYKKGHRSNQWKAHTHTSVWEQVLEPIIEVEEMTLEQICKALGKEIKIVK